MLKLITQQITGGVQKGFWKVLSHRFVRHVGALTAANGINVVLTFVQGILVARWLGPELYGVTALVMSIPAFVYTFFDARSAEASIKYLSEFHALGERQQAAALCRLGYIIDFGVAALAFLSSLLLSSWASRVIVHRPELDWLIIVYACAFIPRSLQGTSYAVLAVQGRFPVIALIGSIATVLRVALVLGLVLAGWNVIGVIWGNTISMSLTGLIYAFYAQPLMRRSWGTISWFTTWSVLKGHRRKVISFLAYNDLNALLGMIPKQLDIVLLGYLRGPLETGFYKLAKSFAVAVGQIAGPLQSVTYPELARLWAMQNKIELSQKIKKLAFQVGLPLGLTVASGTILIPFIVPHLIGEAYRPALPAIELLTISSAVSLAFFWLRPVFMATERIHLWLLFTIIVVVSFTIACPLVIWRWGYLGLSACWLGIIFLGHGIALLKSTPR